MEFSVLSNNLKMPMMGFGVFQVTDKKRVQTVSVERYPHGVSTHRHCSGIR